MNFKELLRPKWIPNHKLIRLGRIYDGGYVIDLEAALQIKNCFTYGVANDISFESDLSAINPSIKVELFDHTVDAPPLLSNMRFHKEGLAGEKKELLNSFFNHYDELGFSGQEGSTLLKLDAEGAEFDFFKTVPLERFSQINSLIIEFHHINTDLSRFTSIIDFLNKNFIITHIHANNCGAEFGIDGFTFPTVPEITFLNKNIYGEGIPLYKKYPISGLDGINEPSFRELNIDFSYD